MIHLCFGCHWRMIWAHVYELSISSPKLKGQCHQKSLDCFPLWTIVIDHSISFRVKCLYFNYCKSLCQNISKVEQIEYRYFYISLSATKNRCGPKWTKRNQTQHRPSICSLPYRPNHGAGPSKARSERIVIPGLHRSFYTERDLSIWVTT